MSPDGIPWLPSQLPGPSAATMASGEWLVHAWLVGSLAAPSCPPGSFLTAADGAEYGCGAFSSLDDTEVPLDPATSPTSPPSGLAVQNGAYGDFAPSLDQLHPIPEQATFLVRAILVPACPPEDFCAFQPTPYRWEIISRVDPWPVPALP